MDKQSKSKFLNILGVTIFLIVFIAIPIYCITSTYNSKFQLQQMQLKLDELSNNSKIVSSSASEAQYLETIEFMKTETETHRTFIEQQQQFLLWVIAIVGSLGIGILGFLGLKSKHDVENIIREKYYSDIEEKFEHLIGGSQNSLYLNSCIEKEKKAKKKKILLLSQPGSKTFEQVEEYLSLKGIGFIPDKTSVNISDDSFIQKIKKYDIVIYVALKCEYKDPKDEDGKKLSTEERDAIQTDPLYKKIAELCGSKNISLIIYSAEHLLKSDFGLLGSIANAPITLLERISTLLYTD